MEKKDDRELVKRCIEGDAAAWVEFVDRFSGLIYWAIKRKLERYDRAYLAGEVEEIYQRALASIWEKKSLAIVSQRENISPWLAVLASNFTIDYLRKKRNEEEYIRTSVQTEEKIEDRAASILSKENSRLLNEAIKLLSEKERAYIELCYASGKKHKEIAEIFNMPMNSVSTTIARAKNKIRRYIESKDKKV